MGIHEKIAEIESQMAKTQVNKATEHHLGLLKAKLARLRREAEAPKKGVPSGDGFAVRKSGNATVVFIGYPSVGKTTMLNALTGAKAKIAAYAFTTLTCIPGILDYKGAKIQLLDLPGVIAGAKEGKGRGKEVLAVARNADLVLVILDVLCCQQLDKIITELEGIGVRLDQQTPKIFIHETDKGGLNIIHGVKLTHLTDNTIRGVMNEYGIYNANVTLRQDATVDQLIDVLVGTRKYIPSLTVVNKVDLVKPEFLKTLDYKFTPISSDTGYNMELLKEEIYKKLNLIHIYTKRKGEKLDDKPLMIRSGSTVGNVCDELHRDMRKLFKFSQVWGKSAKFPGQKVGINHVLQDGDIVQVFKR
ncbi:MAG: GTP-binding protein [Candidatus Micrarchaeota archaeon]